MVKEKEYFYEQMEIKIIKFEKKIKKKLAAAHTQREREREARTNTRSYVLDTCVMVTDIDTQYFSMSIFFPRSVGKEEQIVQVICRYSVPITHSPKLCSPFSLFTILNSTPRCSPNHTKVVTKIVAPKKTSATFCPKFVSPR